jgi:hypothetical protein
MSLRDAINKKCRECTHDPLDAGSAAQQIACCVSSNCPLHSVRPITAKTIPKSLLDTYNISPEQLDARARGLVGSKPIVSEDGQIDLLPTTESISEPTPT